VGAQKGNARKMAISKWNWGDSKKGARRILGSVRGTRQGNFKCRRGGKKTLS